MTADERLAQAQHSPSQDEDIKADSADQGTDHLSSMDASSAENDAQSMPQEVQRAQLSLESPQQIASEEVFPAEAEARSPEEAADTQPESQKQSLIPILPDALDAASLEQEDNLMPEASADPTDGQAEGLQQAAASPQEPLISNAEPTKIAAEQIGDDDLPNSARQQESFTPEDASANPAILEAARQHSLQASDKSLEGSDMKHPAEEDVLPSEQHASLNAAAKTEESTLKSKASLAGKDKKTLPVAETARAMGPNLVTSHRSLIQPKAAAQTLHAAGKRVPEVWHA